MGLKNALALRVQTCYFQWSILTKRSVQKKFSTKLLKLYILHTYNFVRVETQSRVILVAAARLDFNNNNITLFTAFRIRRNKLLLLITIFILIKISCVRSVGPLVAYF